MSAFWEIVGWCALGLFGLGLLLRLLDNVEKKLRQRSKTALWAFRFIKLLGGLGLGYLAWSLWYERLSGMEGFLETAGWYALGVFGFLAFLGALGGLVAGTETPEQAAKRRAKAAEKKAQRRVARSKERREESGGGPIAGSRTVEAMLFEGDPVKTWAARKTRDKFF